MGPDSNLVTISAGFKDDSGVFHLPESVLAVHPEDAQARLVLTKLDRGLTCHWRLHSVIGGKRWVLRNASQPHDFVLDTHKTLPYPSMSIQNCTSTTSEQVENGDISFL